METQDLKPPATSNVYLIETLNSLAAMLKALPESAPVSLGSNYHPAYHWWEVLEWLHQEQPTAWSEFVVSIKRGKWPKVDEALESQVHQAIHCFAGSEARRNYYLLMASGHKDLKNVIKGDNTNEATLTSAYTYMLEMLNQADRDYLRMTETLDLPWYEQWACRNVTCQSHTPIPDDFAGFVDNPT